MKHRSHAVEATDYKSVRHTLHEGPGVVLCAHSHGDSADLHTEHIAHANASAELAPWTLEMA